MKELSNAERLTALHSDSLEYRSLITDLLITYNILFELIDLEAADYFTSYTGPTVRGQKYRLHGKLYRSSARFNFFSTGLLGPWIALPVNIVNFHPFIAFKISLKKVDFSNFLNSQ